MSENMQLGESAACPICKPEMRPHTGIGIPVPMPGVKHRADCPTLPRLSDEARSRLQDHLAEIERCRREAMRRAHEVWIG